MHLFKKAIDTIRDRTHLEIKISGYGIDILRFVNDLAIIVKNVKDKIRKILGAMEMVKENDI